MIEGCILKKRKCDGDCIACGWNISVSASRMHRLRENGLIQGSDGLMRANLTPIKEDKHD